MERYQYGLVFEFEKVRSRCDPTSFLANIKTTSILKEIVMFFLMHSSSEEEALEVLHETDLLLSGMHYEAVLTDHLYFDEASYMKLTGIVFSMCDEVLSILFDADFFKRNRQDKIPYVDVIPLSRGSYMVGLLYPKPVRLSDNELSDFRF